MLIRLASLLLLTSCVRSIRPLYDATREAALADPGPPGASWRPDVVLQLSAPALEDVLRTAVRQQGPLSKRIAAGPAEVVPQIRLKSLEVVPARPCDGGCVGLDAVFEGDLAWSLGPLQGTTRVSARGAVDAALEAVEVKDALVVSAMLRRLRDLEIEVGTIHASIKGIEKSVRTLIETDALAGVPPQPIARFPKSELPIRAARVSAEPPARGQTAVRIDLLTDVPQPGQVAASAAPIEGFAVTLSDATLLGLARAEAFRRGPVGYGVVPEPTALVFDSKGFTLGLRLWRIEGKTWWRDYTIRGTARVIEGALKLAPQEVSEGERSKGAALADPLAALAEGLILRTIEDAIDTSLPLRAQPKIGAAKVTVALDELAPASGAVRASGTITVGGRQEAP